MFGKYSDGNPHTGTDYPGNPVGMPIYAPSNGVVVVSTFTCNDGFLGYKCGSGGGGIAGGGNQV